MHRSLLLVLLAACASDAPNQLVDHDVGIACIDPDAEADQPLEILIMETCFSGSTQDMEASCSVGVDLGVHDVNVASTYAYTVPDEQTDDCNDVQVRCTTTEALPAGSYTLIYGTQTLSFAVPRSEPGASPVCTGD